MNSASSPQRSRHSSAPDIPFATQTTQTYIREIPPFTRQSYQTPARRYNMAAQTTLSPVPLHYEETDISSLPLRSQPPPPPPQQPVLNSTWETISKSLASRLLPHTYSGTPKENPVSYLKKIETLVQSFYPSTDQLKLILTTSLFGAPARWWNQHRHVFVDNQSIMQALREHIISPAYSNDIELRIQLLRQTENEPARDYITRVLSLYDKLPISPPDQAIIKQITFGLLPGYQLHLGGKQYDSITELSSEAFRLDNYFIPHNPAPGPFRQYENQPYQQNQPRDSAAQQHSQARQGSASYRRPPQSESRTQQTYSRNAQPVPNNFYSPRRCFSCNSPNHLIRDCPSRIQALGNGNGGAPRF